MIHSPFPGMDPYLEAPSIWPDVHTSLMSIFREQLTPLLAPKYLAELQTRTRLQGEWQSVSSCSVEPGEIGLTALKEAGDGIDQDTKGRLAELATGLAQR